MLSAPEDLVKPGTNTLVFASRTNVAFHCKSSILTLPCLEIAGVHICVNHLEVCVDHSSPLCGNDVRVPAWMSVHQHHHVALVAPTYILALQNKQQSPQSPQNIGSPYNPQA